MKRTQNLWLMSMVLVATIVLAGCLAEKTPPPGAEQAPGNGAAPAELVEGNPTEVYLPAL